VTFRLIHFILENVREDKLLHKLNTTQKKQTTHNTAKQKCPGSVASFDTWLGNKTGLFYNTPRAHTAHTHTLPRWRMIRDIIY